MSTKFPNKCPFGFRLNFIQRELEIFLDNLKIFENFRSAFGACLTFKKIPLNKFGFPLNVDLYKAETSQIYEETNLPKKTGNINVNLQLNDYSSKGYCEYFENQKGKYNQYHKLFNKNATNQNWAIKQRFSSQTPSNKNDSNMTHNFKNINNNINGNYFENSKTNKEVKEIVYNKAKEFIFPKMNEKNEIVIRNDQNQSNSTKLNYVEKRKKNENLDYPMKLNNYSQNRKFEGFKNPSNDEKQNLYNSAYNLKERRKSEFELLKSKINKGENIIDLLNQLDDK